MSERFMHRDIWRWAHQNELGGRLRQCWGGPRQELQTQCSTLCSISHGPNYALVVDMSGCSPHSANSLQSFSLSVKWRLRLYLTILSKVSITVLKWQKQHSSFSSWSSNILTSVAGTHCSWTQWQGEDVELRCGSYGLAAAIIKKKRKS